MCTGEDLQVWVKAMLDGQLRGRGLRDPAVLAAMAAVPRHRFVPHLDPAQAYADRALPTLDGQTISQPYMVALMTELLDVQPGLKVLEIGTGSGYQAAILAHLGAKVISVERHDGLAAAARETLAAFGYGAAVTIAVGDGTLGWPAAAPYDRIIVTAAAPHVPAAYGTQIVEGGRLVIPVGDREDQTLFLYTRAGGNWLRRESVGCRFVPLLGADGW